jgi:succinyl-CoA synthetase beta subunit
VNVLEHVAKELALAPYGIAIPAGRACATPEEAAAAAAELGAVAVKAQVPAGKRGKSGGIRMADTPEQASAAARAILEMAIGGHTVSTVLVERRASIAREFYAAVLQDAASRSPLVLFSTEGGMDIEEIAAERPASMRRREVALSAGFGEADALAMLDGLDMGAAAAPVAAILAGLYRAFTGTDAELIEVNPLALLADGSVVALDCKLVVDDAALYRQPELARRGSEEAATDLERRGRALGLKFIQLDGNVGVLANGAGLTMTTMDVIRNQGGRPANFLEIGGDAYTKAEPALVLVLANPGVRSLIVNFCGAYARTDVMAEGVVRAWETLKPDIPVFFSIHGTGEDEAVALVRQRLGLQPYDIMEDAVRAAVEAAVEPVMEAAVEAGG